MNLTESAVTTIWEKYAPACFPHLLKDAGTNRLMHIDRV
jgi:hypothetical protein